MEYSAGYTGTAGSVEIDEIFESLEVFLSVFALNPEDPDVIRELIPLFEKLKAITSSTLDETMVNLLDRAIELLNSMARGVMISDLFASQLIQSAVYTLQEQLSPSRKTEREEREKSPGAPLIDPELFLNPPPAEPYASSFPQTNREDDEESGKDTPPDYSQEEDVEAYQADDPQTSPADEKPKRTSRSSGSRKKLDRSRKVKNPFLPDDAPDRSESAAADHLNCREEDGGEILKVQPDEETGEDEKTGEVDSETSGDEWKEDDLSGAPLPDEDLSEDESYRDEFGGDISDDFDEFEDQLLDEAVSQVSRGEEFDISSVSGRDLELFYNAARQNLETVYEDVSMLTDGFQRETVESIIRAFQGLNGASAFINHLELAVVTDTYEKQLQALLKSENPGEEMQIFLADVTRFTEGFEHFLDRIKSRIDSVSSQSVLFQDSSIAEYRSAGHSFESGVSGKNERTSFSSRSSADAVGFASSKTMRIAISKINELMNAVEELLITNSSLVRIQEELSGHGLDTTSTSVKTLFQIYVHFEKVTEMMHGEMLAMRMSPVQSLFGAFKRVIESLSVQQDKQITVRVSGEDTQVDRLVLETLKDPLIHLVRNAVDHGVEKPEQRIAAGKNPMGTVALRAFNDINSVVIEIEDDGKGIDPRHLAEKIVDKGLASDSEIAFKTDREILDYIFHAGFSTAEKVTDISGRGVGMDVVKTSLQAMGGTIDIDTTPGEGTCFIIRLPLALTMADALVVQTGNESYSIPTDSIERIMKTSPEKFRSICNSAVLSLPGRTLPYSYLSDIVGIPQSGADSGENPEPGLLLILKSGRGAAALGVDRILGKRKVVIKNLGGFLNAIPGISGACIQGDGSVMLVLDGEAICERMTSG